MNKSRHKTQYKNFILNRVCHPLVLGGLEPVESLDGVAHIVELDVAHVRLDQRPQPPEEMRTLHRLRINNAKNQMNTNAKRLTSK